MILKMCFLCKVWNENIFTHFFLSFDLKLKAKANKLGNVLVLAMLNSQDYYINETFKRISKIKKYKWLIKHEMTVHLLRAVSRLCNHRYNEQF